MKRVESRISPTPQNRLSVISGVLIRLPCYVLRMIVLKQLAFSLVFTIAAVAAAQYVIWILNGQP